MAQKDQFSRNQGQAVHTPNGQDQILRIIGPLLEPNALDHRYILNELKRSSAQEVSTNFTGPRDQIQDHHHWFAGLF